MGSRLAIVAGVVAGVLVAALALGALVAFLPPIAVPTPPTASGSPVPSPSPSSSAGLSASPSSAPASASAGPSEAPFMIGEPAPPLDVAQLGGGRIDIAALRGKPVWVNFMATWCPPCRDELPLMTGFASRYADTGLVVIAVDVDEDEAVVGPFMAELGVTFPVGLDPDGAASEAWRVASLPIHFWVDASGIIRDGAVGGIGPDVMAAGLESILPGVDVEP